MLSEMGPTVHTWLDQWHGRSVAGKLVGHSGAIFSRTEFHGQDIKQEITTSWKQCDHMCVYDLPECNAWTWVESKNFMVGGQNVAHGTCFFKRAPMSAPGLVSGRRGASIEECRDKMVQGCEEKKNQKQCLNLFVKMNLCQKTSEECTDDLPGCKVTHCTLLLFKMLRCRKTCGTCQ